MPQVSSTEPCSATIENIVGIAGVAIGALDDRKPTSSGVGEHRRKARGDRILEPFWKTQRAISVPATSENSAPI